jgi:hypothetical protein
VKSSISRWLPDGQTETQKLERARRGNVTLLWARKRTLKFGNLAADHVSHFLSLPPQSPSPFFRSSSTHVSSFLPISSSPHKPSTPSMTSILKRSQVPSSWQYSKRCVLILLACFSSLTTSPADSGGLICDRETPSRPQDLGISTPASSRPQDTRPQDPRHQDLKRPPSGSTPS